MPISVTMSWDEYDRTQDDLASLRQQCRQCDETLWVLGCRTSCMGWVNERAEIAERKVAEAKALHEQRLRLAERVSPTDSEESRD